MLGCVAFVFQGLAHGFVVRGCVKRRMAPVMVFSGIVEEMGTVVSLSKNPEMAMWDGSVSEGTEIRIRGKIAVEDAYIGCSIAVDGVCLTATELDSEASELKLGLSPETLRRTTLGSLEAGDMVNLERSLSADGRNSGHYVQGHVDGTGTIDDKWQEGDSLWFRIRAPRGLMTFIVPKGYIAVDGTSLTVCDVDDNTFTLMLVEHTQKCIVLPTKAAGAAVNLEVDVIAKYSQKALSAMASLTRRVDDLERRLSEVEVAGTDCTGLD
ncbi:hypothetical protein CTAYLR_000818 [Chrysophaeum taylorii]|uniref:Riboflavin synthase n=1 Tax=Chrysophaeum taylorii TaxID=2483200 RepID=A0AAD7UQT0_9STRA|nr:hypothetical protein CTAYLR_000818 [Chrysophaeum taylorii]